MNTIPATLTKAQFDNLGRDARSKLRGIRDDQLGEALRSHYAKYGNDVNDAAFLDVRVAALRLMYPRASAVRIAEMLGVHPQTVRGRDRRMSPAVLAAARHLIASRGPSPAGGQWRDRAACRGSKVPDAWYESPTTPAHAYAVKVCGGCPVAVECFAEALVSGESWGTWGGTYFAPRFGRREETA